MMQEYLVLTLVVIISIAAHVWLFLWIRFRIDEAVVVKCLEEDSGCGGLSAEAMAQRIDYKAERVAAVCEKSSKILCLDSAAGLWGKA